MFAEVTVGHNPDMTLKYSHTVVNGLETCCYSHSTDMPTTNSTNTIILNTVSE